MDRSVKFYKALGFRQVVRLKTSLGEAAQLEFPRRGITIELNYFPRGSKVFEAYRKGSELDHFGFEVDDVDAWVARLRRVGGTVEIRPFDSELWIPPRTFDGRAAYVSDPDGIWIELMGPRRKDIRGPAQHGMDAAGRRPKAE